MKTDIYTIQKQSKNRCFFLRVG